MSSHSIASILEDRAAFLKGPGGDVARTHQRAPLIHAIEENYPVFEPLRDGLLQDRPPDAGWLVELTDVQATLIEHLRMHGLVAPGERGLAASGVEARRFLSGGWLEELAWLAAMEAGAEEARFSQVVGWSVAGFEGENEIDLILRSGPRLGFVSCKALRSELSAKDRKHRNRLMDALHEADNLADHFGAPGERVGVLVTTDLFDEAQGVARYTPLMGKAAVLDVRLIPLEEILSKRLVAAMAELIA